MMSPLKPLIASLLALGLFAALVLPTAALQPEPPMVVEARVYVDGSLADP